MSTKRDLLNSEIKRCRVREPGVPLGARPGYPIPDVYCAFVRDPFGNKLEAIHNGFTRAS